MTKDEALSTARRLLERAGPWTEILIKAQALTVLVETTMPHPDSLDEKTLFAMWDAQNWPHDITKCDAMRAAYKALYDRLTRPKTKMLGAWYVEYCDKSQPATATFMLETQAIDHADNLRGYDDFQCVQVTGPHLREVPT